MTSTLKSKLTMTYGAILGGLLIVLYILNFAAIRDGAHKQVNDELHATLLIFEKLWKINEKQLSENAETLARDFGFKAAVATGDQKTIRSAINNLRSRIDLDRAILVFADGMAVDTDSTSAYTISPSILDRLLDVENARGVATLNDSSYQMVSTGVSAPVNVGWLLLGTKLDRQELEELEELSAIPVLASIQTSRWTEPVQQDDFIVAATSLAGFDGASSTQLILKYPLDLAMAQYNRLFSVLLLMSFAGLAFLVSASFVISRSVTEPIAYLDRATEQLSKGEQVNLVVDSNDEVGRLTANFLAMAQKIRAREKHIVELSKTHPDTGLQNRRALEEMLDDICLSDLPGPFFCVAVGVRNLTSIRSALGHDRSNELMRKFGERCNTLPLVLQYGQVASDIVAFITMQAGPNELSLKLDGLLEALTEPIEISGQPIDIQINVGVTLHEDGTKIGTIDRSSIALLEARKDRRSVAFFDVEEFGDPTKTLSLMSDMLNGLEDGSIFLAYQPKLSLCDGEIRSVEALIRWVHPERGFVPPDLFVEHSEETGHIKPLSEWVIRQSVKDRIHLSELGYDLHMSVNLSGQLLADDEFISTVLEIIGDQAEHLCFEITETAVIDDPRAALTNITRLQGAGCEISIDDYGSGLSSLSYLKQIPAQELKIDKDFVLKLDENDSDLVLVKSTIDLAHSLGMRITAEGVENAQSLTLLKSMSADLAQGYHISRPVPLMELVSFLQEWSRSGEADHLTHSA